jgi:chorismate dehydratase
MRLRLGRIRYINCEPIYFALERGIVPADCTLHYGTPAELNAQLRSGALDVSVVSVMEPALCPEAYVMLPDLAIACDGPVESVLLASTVPLAELDGCPVSLTSQSLTSIYLIKFLLDRAYGIAPKYQADDRPEEAAARLLIGDEALRLGPGFPHRLDLGEAWRRLTGLPFVFAVWAVRRSVWESAPDSVRGMHAALQASKAYGRTAPDDVVASACAHVALAPDACRRYLAERLCFDLGERHRQGLQGFLALLVEAGALPGVPALRFLTL